MGQVFIENIKREKYEAITRDNWLHGEKNWRMLIAVTRFSLKGKTNDSIHAFANQLQDKLHLYLTRKLLLYYSLTTTYLLHLYLTRILLYNSQLTCA